MRRVTPSALKRSLRKDRRDTISPPKGEWIISPGRFSLDIIEQSWDKKIIFLGDTMMKRNSICAAALCLVLMLPACLLAENHVSLFKETYSKAVAGDAEAQQELGRMYFNGLGVSRDYREAVKWYEKAAGQGLAGAQFYLGVMYFKGEGVPKDDREAVRWYTRAAEQGHAEAQFYLGVMCVKGEGIPGDYREAAKWYARAAGQGLAGAQFNLGVMYFNGEGVSKDDQEAVKWISKAALQGLAGAQYNLGLMYARGYGVPKDGVQAYKWLDLAAVQGIEKARELRDSVEKEMTPGQVAEARRLSREFRVENERP